MCSDCTYIVFPAVRALDTPPPSYTTATHAPLPASEPPKYTANAASNQVALPSEKLDSFVWAERCNHMIVLFLSHPAYVTQWSPTTLCLRNRVYRQFFLLDYFRLMASENKLNSRGTLDDTLGTLVFEHFLNNLDLSFTDGACRCCYSKWICDTRHRTSLFRYLKMIASIFFINTMKAKWSFISMVYIRDGSRRESNFSILVFVLHT